VPQAPGESSTYLLEPASSAVAVRRTRVQVALSGLLVLALVAGGMLLVFGRNSQDANAAVSLAAHDSAAATTAHVAMSGSVTLGTRNVGFTGTGDIDFGHDAAQLTMAVNAFGHNVTAKVVYVGGTVYVNAAELGSLLGGKTWISIDASALGGAAAGGIDTGLNPSVWQQLLAQGNNQATTLGSSTVDGTKVQGYSVVISPSTLKSDLSSKLPSWVGSALDKSTVGPLTLKVYVDDNNLVRRVTVTTQVSAGSRSAQVQESTTYSAYGTPVDVTAPPPATVATLGQLMKSLPGAAHPTRRATRRTPAGGSTQ
jgi:hypothetical protein